MAVLEEIEQQHGVCHLRAETSTVQSFVEAGHYDGISTGKNTTVLKKYSSFAHSAVSARYLIIEANKCDLKSPIRCDRIGLRICFWYNDINPLLILICGGVGSKSTTSLLELKPSESLSTLSKQVQYQRDRFWPILCYNTSYHLLHLKFDQCHE